MEALRLELPRQFKLIEVPEPDPPAAGEALVRVHGVGICGTDISAYLGKMPFVTYPRILGHELGVEVIAVGENVTNIRPGDRCSVEPYLNDPTSYASRRGKPNCCEKLQVLGVHIDQRAALHAEGGGEDRPPAAESLERPADEVVRLGGGSESEVVREDLAGRERPVAIEGSQVHRAAPSNLSSSVRGALPLVPTAA